ncbi:hypothetical protein [Janibacter indicus]|uniref:hypothetical protein n=1 Tax=Janibacter indicus TaxID=857417 RepID=UPI000A0358BB|nr:hypothetical protein [Janibacter indicus]
MADRVRRWPAALGGLAAGSVGLLLVVGAVGVAESVLAGGQTHEWCEELTDDPTVTVRERCVRERDNRNLVAPDEHLVEFYYSDTGGVRFEPHPWPLSGEVDVEFGDGSVTLRNDAGMTTTYPDEVFRDAR